MSKRPATKKRTTRPRASASASAAPGGFQPPKPHIPSVDDLRAIAQPFPVTIGRVAGREWTVLCRPLDPMELLWTDTIPSHLVSAAAHIMGQGLKLRGGDLAAIAEIPIQQRVEMLETFRRYAVASVVEPALTMHPEAEPDKADVRVLELSALLAIWSAVPPRPKGAPAPTTVDQASEFRRDGGAADGGAASNGAGLRPAPESVGDAGDDAYRR